MQSEFWRRQRIRRAERQRSRDKGIPWSILIFLLLATVALPTVADVALARVHPQFLRGLQWFLIVLYSFASIMMLWEGICALRLPLAPPEPTSEEMPCCTALIAAYLPNEQDIILETVLHMLGTIALPKEKFQVLLAYNTPETLPIEKVLQDLADHDSRLCLRRVEGSHSKAENVNAAIADATGEIIAIYDADHLPEARCFHKAWRWLSNGYQVVQGRCVIRNHNENWLTRTVAVEFDIIYAVSHQGRSTLSHTAIFGGSDGYWQAEALRAVGMNGAMLTEDIDSSVRTLLAGRHLIHDRTICSFELAPARPRHWFFQRKRWSQGWLEVTLRYQHDLLRSRHLNALQKFIWFYLLGWREVYPLLSMQFYPLIFASWWMHYPLHWFRPGWFLATSLFNLTSGLWVLGIAARCASREGRRGLSAWYFIYGVFSLVYTTLKTFVTLVAQYAHATCDTTWVTTPRAPESSAPITPPKSRQGVLL